MTVTAETNKDIAIANGTQDTFYYTFKIYKSSDLKVYIKTDAYQTLQVEGTNYEVTGVGNEDGGSVVFYETSLPPLYSKVILYGDYDYKQEVDYVENDSFPADSHENVVDKLTWLHIKVNEKLGRCLKLAVDSEIEELTFPNPSASKLIGWDDDAENLINYTNPAIEAKYWAEIAESEAAEGSAFVIASAANASYAADSATTVSGYMMDIDTAIANSTATVGQLALVNGITISGTWGSSYNQLRSLVDTRYTTGGISVYPSGDPEDNFLQYSYADNPEFITFKLHSDNDAAMVYFAVRRRLGTNEYSDWTYYATASGHTLDSDGFLTEITTQSGAITNYWQIDEGPNTAHFPYGTIGAHVRMYVVPSGTYNAKFYSAVPNRFVGAEYGAFENLSAYNAVLGHVYGGSVSSLNWGTTAGSYFNLNDGDLSIGGSIDPKLKWDGTTLSIKGNITIGNPSDVRTDINVEDGATASHTFRQDNEPSSGMNEGDIWYDTNDGNKVYYYNGSSWVLVRDADIDIALANAASAQSTADGKIVTFYQTEPPASGVSSHGDLWFDINDGNKLYRYNTDTWVVTQDDGIAQAITAAAEAQDTADGKIVTFYDTEQPASGTCSVGDLWYDTDASNKPLYRYNGSSWQLVADVTSANTAANTSYVGTVPASVVQGWRSGATTYIDGGNILTNSIYLSNINGGTGNGELNITAGYIGVSTVSGLRVKSGGDIIVEDGGDIIMNNNNVSPAEITFNNSTYGEICSLKTLTGTYAFEIAPPDDSAKNLWIGNTNTQWLQITLYADYIYFRGGHSYFYEGSYLRFLDDSTTATTMRQVNTTFYLEPEADETYSLNIGDPSSDGWDVIRLCGHTVYSYNLKPYSTGGVQDLGDTSYYWNRCYTATYYYKNSSQSFDKYDDLQLLDDASNYVDKKTGHEMIDYTTFPDEFFAENEDGTVNKDFVRMDHMQSLSFGAIKQLNREVTEDIYEQFNAIIEDQQIRIKRLETALEELNK